MLTETQAKPRELPLAVRAFATPVKPRKKQHSQGGLKKPSKWIVVFDTETTVDEAFTFRIGVYHLYKDDQLYEKGLFFDLNPKLDKISDGG